jgi:hypothetical protein
MEAKVSKHKGQTERVVVVHLLQCVHISNCKSFASTKISGICKQCQPQMNRTILEELYCSSTVLKGNSRDAD